MSERFSHSVKNNCSLLVALFVIASCSSMRPTRLSVPVTELRQVQKLAGPRPPYGETLKARGTDALRVEAVFGLRVIRKDREAIPVPVPFTVELASGTLTLKGKSDWKQVKLDDVDYLEVDARAAGPWRPTDYLAVVAVTVGALFCVAAVSMISSDD